MPTKYGRDFSNNAYAQLQISGVSIIAAINFWLIVMIF